MPEEGKQVKIHIVQKGDTLWKIAQKYGVNFEELKKMNAQLSNPDMIMPGMKIKVPAGGTHVKKEKPHVSHGGHKEMPKEHHHPPKVHKEVKKEIIKKEVPQKIYQPVMPQPLPEIDVSNYYMMNMNQMQAQVQQQPPPKEVEVVKEVPQVEVMPIQGGCPPVYPQYYCPPPVMPVCDPCYPYPMMPQVQGMMAYPQMPMGGYMQQMPMYTQMPAVMPAAEYGVMPQHWGDESSSSSSMEMYHHHHGHHHGHHHHHDHHHMGEEVNDPPPYSAMPMQGWSQPSGGYPMMPVQQGQPMGMPYGTMPFGQQPMPGAGGPYPMMPRVDEEEDD
ncbi:SafA/ExsA family spore coat assembly protein [Siminovitchia terrae]|uniref:SafA/ExsA family spore coat assembly protein n=1 Tax=Siminovitchia terrae TaxID=1914933 RepID=A0A429X7B8_SIMTE|nr:SafA/ExsA family spore coat assembly protein [Siminovitchia terrae]